MFVKGIATGSEIPVQVGLPFDDTPPVREEDSSPGPGDAKATCEVFDIQIRGNHSHKLWYVKWVLGWHGFLGHLGRVLGGCDVGRKRSPRLEQ